MDKIKMITPLVEIDGDEMTRIIWQLSPLKAAILTASIKSFCMISLMKSLNEI